MKLPPIVSLAERCLVMAKQSAVVLEFHRLNDGPRFAYQLKDWDTQPHTLKLMGRWGGKRDGLIYTLQTSDTTKGSCGNYHHARMVCNIGDPKVVKGILDEWQHIMQEKAAANEPLVLIEDGRMVFRVEVPLPVESEEQ